MADTPPKPGEWNAHFERLTNDQLKGAEYSLQIFRRWPRVNGQILKSLDQLIDDAHTEMKKRKDGPVPEAFVRELYLQAKANVNDCRLDSIDLQVDKTELDGFALSLALDPIDWHPEPCKHPRKTKAFRVFHWDTFDPPGEDTIQIHDADTIEEAEAWIRGHYGDRLRESGADKVDIVDQKGNVVRSWRVG